MKKPRLLDLFCGAGGAAMGYHRAGFDVYGVDIKPQPNYPFPFVQADALEYPLDGFDAVHASPPCQAYCEMRSVFKTPREHPRLIEPMREKLLASGLPYVIENVRQAPLVNPCLVCGSTLGLKVRRHRLFESNRLLFGFPCDHSGEKLVRPIGVYGDHPQSHNDKSYRINRARNVEEASEAMGISWMTWRELCESIPPKYTEMIGSQLFYQL